MGWFLKHQHALWRVPEHVDPLRWTRVFANKWHFARTWLDFQWEHPLWWHQGLHNMLFNPRSVATPQNGSTGFVKENQWLTNGQTLVESFHLLGILFLFMAVFNFVLRCFRAYPIIVSYYILYYITVYQCILSTTMTRMLLPTGSSVQYFVARGNHKLYSLPAPLAMLPLPVCSLKTSHHFAAFSQRGGPQLLVQVGQCGW